MKNLCFDVFPVVNAIQYMEHEEYVEGTDSVWATEEDARLRLAELAIEKSVDFGDSDSIFYEDGDLGPNVEYSEWRIDTWEVYDHG